MSANDTNKAYVIDTLTRYAQNASGEQKGNYNHYIKVLEKHKDLSLEEILEVEKKNRMFTSAVSFIIERKPVEPPKKQAEAPARVTVDIKDEKTRERVNTLTGSQGDYLIGRFNEMADEMTARGKPDDAKKYTAHAEKLKDLLAGKSPEEQEAFFKGIKNADHIRDRYKPANERKYRGVSDELGGMISAFGRDSQNVRSKGEKQQKVEAPAHVTVDTNEQDNSRFPAYIRKDGPLSPNLVRYATGTEQENYLRESVRDAGQLKAILTARKAVDKNIDRYALAGSLQEGAAAFADWVREEEKLVKAMEASNLPKDVVDYQKTQLYTHKLEAREMALRARLETSRSMDVTDRDGRNYGRIGDFSYDRNTKRSDTFNNLSPQDKVFTLNELISVQEEKKAFKMHVTKNPYDHMRKDKALWENFGKDAHKEFAERETKEFNDRIKEFSKMRDEISRQHNIDSRIVNKPTPEKAPTQQSFSPPMRRAVEQASSPTYTAPVTHVRPVVTQQPQKQVTAAVPQPAGKSTDDFDADFKKMVAGLKNKHPNKTTKPAEAPAGRYAVSDHQSHDPVVPRTTISSSLVADNKKKSFDPDSGNSIA